MPGRPTMGGNDNRPSMAVWAKWGAQSNVYRALRCG